MVKNDPQLLSVKLVLQWLLRLVTLTLVVGDLATYVNKLTKSDVSLMHLTSRQIIIISWWSILKVAVICWSWCLLLLLLVQEVLVLLLVDYYWWITLLLSMVQLWSIRSQERFSVKVGSVKLTAGASDVTVSSLVVTRSGLGNAADISSVQLTQNGVALVSLY